jgi:ubiquinone biosynthesis protein UbiJ
MSAENTLLETLDMLGLADMQEAVASEIGTDVEEAVTLVQGTWRADELDALDQVAERLSARPETAEAAASLKQQIATARTAPHSA